MKKKWLILLSVLTMCLCLAFGLSACAASEPAEKQTLSFKTLQLTSDDAVYGKVANGTTTFSFKNEIETTGDATYNVYTDLSCNAEFIVPSKVVPLNSVENTFYVLGNVDGKELFYTVTIRVRQLYTVEFNSLDGSAVESQTIEEDSCAVLPNVPPTKAGYTFTDWDFDFATPITQPITVMAKQWQANTYQVSFAGNGVNELPISVTYDSAYGTLPTLTRTGYTFNGWYSEATGGIQITESSTVKITANQTLHAQWIAIPYDITYNLANGVASNPVTYTIESNAIILNNPTKTGYTFIGWTGTDLTQKTMTVYIPQGSMENREYTANWQVIPYDITYTLNNGTASNPETYTVGDSVTLNNPTRAGYTFIGWTGTGLAQNAMTVTIPQGSTGAKNYTANWQIDNYSITYKLNDGEATNSNSYTVEDEITLNNPIKTGYTFIGWTGTGLTQKTLTVTIPQGSTEDRSYTANWQANTYQVSFTGDGVNELPISVTYDSAYGTLPTLTRTGYIFNGWYTEATGGEQITESSTVKITADQTLYVRWNTEVTYTLSGSTYSVTGLNDNTLKNITILDTYNGKSVTSINSRAFENCSGLTSVTIGNSVTSIGERAFENCRGLTSVTIGNSVKSIGSYAFYNCSGLTSVTIGNSVTSIGFYAFENCSGLTSITIPDKVTSIGDYAFAYCSKLIEVYNLSTLPITAGSEDNGCVGYYAKNVYTANSGTRKLTTTDDGFIVYADDSAQEYYLVGYVGEATEITLPAKINGNNYVINYFAFKNCHNLTSIMIPDSVTGIGDLAFGNCSSLNSIKVAKENAVYHTEGNCIIETASKTLILGCKNSIIPLDGSVTSIGKYAFSGCSGLTSITIPDSVTSIGDEAFYNCSSLTSITIPDSVTSIGSFAFYSCSGLTSVTIGNSLTSITIPNSVTSIGNHAFYSCSGLTSVTIGNSVTTIGNHAFYSCSGLTSVTIGNSVTTIGDYAFRGCSSLTKVNYTGTIDEWASKITFGGESANPLYYAKHLYINDQEVTEVNLTTATKINNYAFFNCSSLTSINIPNSVESIGGSVFDGCCNLKNVTIGNGVTSIGIYAFVNCGNLASVTMENSVESIGNWVFCNCSSLTNIIFKGTKAQWTAISKGNGWNTNTGNYIITCTDGTLSK